MKIVKSILAVVLAMSMSVSGVVFAAEESSLTKLDFAKNLGQFAKYNVTEKSTDDEYIKEIFAKRILSGDSKQFKKDSKVTNETALVMAIKALNVEQVAKKFNDESLLKDFADKKSISTWAKPYVMYALKNQLIDNSFKPQMNVNSDFSKALVEKSKSFYDKNLTREGLNATEMLDAANKKILESKTYKFKTTMSGKTTAKTPQGTEVMNMSIVQDGNVAAVDNLYLKQTMIMKDVKSGVESKVNMEMVLKDKAVYTKVEGTDKWTKMDMAPFMDDIKALTSGTQNSPILSREQLETFGMYAQYDKDVTVDGKDYYVVNIDLDKDTFKNVMKQLMEKAAKLSADIAMKQDPNVKVDSKELANAMGAMFNTMDITMNMKYYITKADKVYDKSDIGMTMKMNMAPASIDMVMNGSSTIFDQGKEVVVPVIKDSDVQTIEQMMKSVETAPAPVQAPKK